MIQTELAAERLRIENEQAEIRLQNELDALAPETPSDKWEVGT
jgi:hypothetical protein